jgi:hypothetical protein
MNGKDVLPSGQTWDDMYKHVFKEMEKYFAMKKNSGEQEEIEDHDDDDSCGGQLSSNLFPGWMVFVLFGPYGPEPRYPSDWLKESPESANGESRRAARKRDAERDSKERSKHIESTWGFRGQERA